MRMHNLRQRLMLWLLRGSLVKMLVSTKTQGPGAMDATVMSCLAEIPSRRKELPQTTRAAEDSSTVLARVNMAPEADGGSDTLLVLAGTSLLQMLEGESTPPASAVGPLGNSCTEGEAEAASHRKLTEVDLCHTGPFRREWELHWQRRRSVVESRSPANLTCDRRSREDDTSQRRYANTSEARGVAMERTGHSPSPPCDSTSSNALSTIAVPSLPRIVSAEDGVGLWEYSTAVPSLPRIVSAEDYVLTLPRIPIPPPIRASPEGSRSPRSPRFMLQPANTLSQIDSSAQRRPAPRPGYTSEFLPSNMGAVWSDSCRGQHTARNVWRTVLMTHVEQQSELMAMMDCVRDSLELIHRLK